MAASTWLMLGIVLLLLGFPFTLLVLTLYAPGSLILTGGILVGGGGAFLFVAATERAAERERAIAPDNEGPPVSS